MRPSPNQFETPLFSGLLAHAARNPLQFHIPGHKKGAGMEPTFRRFLGDNALSIDLINIAPLDDLHNPHGMIKAAESLAAEAFGADHTFFSVQGTSGAIMTMIMAVCGPGEKILIPRNVHKSVIGAIVLAGAIPIYMQPDLDTNLGIAHGVAVDAVRAGIAAHPNARAVLVINPTYYGVAADLKSIVDLAHAARIPVLVDEAHGVHVHFHEQLPLSAMQAGADIAATSVHKLGGALTQASVLNVREGLVNPGRVQAIYSMLTTTSTSYLLLASLDVARKHLATAGRDHIERARTLAQEARRAINQMPGLYCFGTDIIGQSSSRFEFDPTKLCISVRGLGLAGSEVEVILRQEFNIEVELSDLYNVLCILSLGDTDAEVTPLLTALRTIAERTHRSRPANPVRVRLPQTPVLAMSPREAFYAQTEVIPFAAAAGRIVAEFLMVYPPGIPIVLPGEVLSTENIAYTHEHLAAGLPVQGPEDETLQTLKVVRR